MCPDLAVRPEGSEEGFGFYQGRLPIDAADSARRKRSAGDGEGERLSQRSAVQEAVDEACIEGVAGARRVHHLDRVSPQAQRLVPANGERPPLLPA